MFWIESIGRGITGSILLWLALILALAPTAINQNLNQNALAYRRLVVLGASLGLAFGLDWWWGSWLFIFFIYLKSRKWLPIHKIAGHNLFWLGYLSGASLIISLSWLIQNTLWLRVNNLSVNLWLWLGVNTLFLFFLADGLRRLQRQAPSYWHNLSHELILIGLLLLSNVIATYFDPTRFLTMIPILWVCYRPVLVSNS